VAPATVFALASVSKPFTAALALLLDACGVMPLSTRAASLVSYADVRSEATIEDLLRHEGGMSDWLTDKYTRMSWLIQNPNGKVGPKTAVQNLLPRGEIGDFDYSNSSFTLITLAAEKATGVSWRELLQELIIKPLGLKETAFGPVAGASRTHIWSRGKMRPFGQPGWGPTRSAAAILRGAGDLFATPRDLAKFGELLWGDRLLEGGQTQLINGIANLTGLPWSYTVGTMMDRSWLGTLRTYGHTGGYSGASTTLRRIPELGVTIAVTANGMGTPGNYADDLAINLISLLDTPAPSAAQAVAGASGAGLRASSRANPEPFPVTPPASLLACGGSGTSVGGAPSWLDLSSTGDWSGLVTALAELPDGRLVAGGAALTRAGGVAVSGLAARDPKAGSWASFASITRADGSAATVNEIRVDGVRQRLYVGGDFVRVSNAKSRATAKGIAMLNLKTGRWTALGDGLRGAVVVRSISLDQESGRIAVGGRFTVPGKAKTMNVGVWDLAKGWVELKGGSGSGAVQGVVESVALTADGVVHASGYLRIGTQEALVARWSPLVSGWRASATSSVLGDAPHTLVLDAGGTLTAGTGVGWYGSPLVRESQLSGYGWERVGGGVTRIRRAAWITALAATPDGRVVVGGVFDAAGSTGTQHIAVWSAASQSFSAIGEGLAAEPDALVSSVNSVAYASLRLRSVEPGGRGRICITAWGAAPPSKPAAPALTAKRTSITVRWAAPPTGSAPFGWIAEATAKGQTTRSCRADASERECTITSLTPGATYSVRLVAYTIPAGSSPRSDAVKIATKK
jgi:CubicO group peptidase (beta-lactamase class C family)